MRKRNATKQRASKKSFKHKKNTKILIGVGVREHKILTDQTRAGTPKGLKVISGGVGVGRCVKKIFELFSFVKFF